ncbi:hypothetical protein JTE90_023789 [Oedothorax gibbosus]|uniref:Histone acetyltransferase n=1 Tax=Oedothorax gibbosus TaxID=931172 RepID=A0AAV6VHG3_9ARAC|nr:hypothetical protein JTE90_023789 [Oedothorax gibbosus]
MNKQMASESGSEDEVAHPEHKREKSVARGRKPHKKPPHDTDSEGNEEETCKGSVDEVAHPEHKREKSVGRGRKPHRKPHDSDSEGNEEETRKGSVDEVAHPEHKREKSVGRGRKPHRKPPHDSDSEGNEEETRKDSVDAIVHPEHKRKSFGRGRKPHKKPPHDSDSEENGEDTRKGYHTRGSQRFQNLQTTEKKSVNDANEDSFATPNSKAKGKKGKKSMHVKQGIDEDVVNNSGSKGVSHKSKKEKGKDVSSDSASDTPGPGAAKKLPGKKKRSKGKGKGLAEHETVADLKEDYIELKCPVALCDSKGHLSGLYESHFTCATCPVYHNLTPEKCIEMAKLRQERENERQMSAESSALSKFGLRKVGPTPEQKEQYGRLLEQRRKSYNENKANLNGETKEAKASLNSEINEEKASLNGENKEAKASLNGETIEAKASLNGETKEAKGIGDKSRKPILHGLAPEYDIELFHEAQARAAQAFEEMLQQHKNKHGRIHTLEMGRYEMDVWYKAPYPEEYQKLPKLFICEFCLKYMNSQTVLRRHMAKCIWKFPPGDEIYRRGNISFFEVDGQKSKTYCQNLCLLAKLFLDHKTLYFDVEPFLFYVMTEADNEGCHIIGYFSKEKNSFLNYNVSCILTLPPYQRQGYGRMLIDFSYLLSKVEGKIGSPEKPLSDLGLISYRSYWKSILLEYLSTYEGKEVSIKDISHETAVLPYDIVSTLQALSLLKYWKGKHIVLQKQELLDDYISKAKKRKADKTISREFLHWCPSIPNNNLTEH